MFDYKLRSLEEIVEAIERSKDFTDNSIPKIKILVDDRIRCYFKEVFAKTKGQTRGSSFVLEYNPMNHNVRAWQECYDHFGKVNRVHPKMKMV